MGWTLAHAGSSASVDSTAYSVSRIIFHTRLYVIPAPVVSESYPASFHNWTCSQRHDSNASLDERRWRSI